MGLIKEFFANRVLFAAVLGWLCAQVLKLIITACMTKKVNVERLWGAGGMPSAHSAMVCALTISVARFYGVSDPLFALAVMFAFVTMYDAMGVRREAGEHARRARGAVRVPAQDPGADGFQDRRTSLLQPRGGGADGRAA